MTPVPVTREERTQRLLRDRAAALAAGRRVGGTPPYGFRARGGELVPVPAEQAVRWLVIHLAGNGWSSRRIAGELDRLQIAPRQGAKWSHATVHRIVAAAAGLEDTG